MVLLENIFNSATMADAYVKSEDINNTMPMVGEAFFPKRKKLGLDISDIRTHKGQYVQLAASNFDAMPTLRPRGTFTGSSRQMAFFRESMQIREHDLLALMGVEASNAAFIGNIMDGIYDDTNELIRGAAIVPEIMRMQLLAPINGKPRIYIEDNGVLYDYNYDPDGTYATENYVALTGPDAWTAPDTAKPFDTFRTIKRTLGARGTTPRYALMNQNTFDLLAQIKSFRNIVLAQNATANVDIDDDMVRSIWQRKTGTSIIVYDKVYTDKATGAATPFYPDNYVTFLPAGALGYTWFGTTPEERTKLAGTGADVTIVDTGIAVATKAEYGPPHTITTTASMICLPSYERIGETYVVKVAE